MLSSRAIPQIALVDELAHTNAPAAAIRNAISTLRNCSRTASTSTPRSIIQHTRASTTWSRRSRMSGARTVPDSVFDRADAIELIDLSRTI